MGGARHYWQHARLLASCATSSSTWSAMKSHSSKRSRIRQVLRFAAQPPMHFRTMPLDPAPDYSMFGNADFTDRFSRIPVAMPTCGKQSQWFRVAPSTTVKVIPFSHDPPASVVGYFTQQKFIWGKTPEEIQTILGIFGKLREGACVLEFAMPLGPRDFETRAYSYLPDGKEYKPKPKEKMYLPGKGAPQWVLKGDVRARCIARLKPREPFTKSTLIP